MNDGAHNATYDGDWTADLAKTESACSRVKQLGSFRNSSFALSSLHHFSHRRDYPPEVW